MKNAHTYKSSNLAFTEAPDKFSHIKALANTIFSKSDPNHYYLAEWLNQLSIWSEKHSLQSEDMNTSITISSDCSEILLKHEIHFIKSFGAVKNFCEIAKKSDFSNENLSNYKKMLLSFTPLSVSMYIKLGKNMDCGIGIEKPLDSGQLRRFLKFTSESENIFIWAGCLIPTAIYLSVLNPSRTVEFYLFDGHKAQNHLKGVSLFDHFGKPLEKSLKDQIMKSKGESLTAVIEANHSKILSAGLRIQSALYIDSLFPKNLISSITTKITPETTYISQSPQGNFLHFSSTLSQTPSIEY